MKTKYKIGDIVSVQLHRYKLTSPIIAIRDYGDFKEYILNGIDMGFTFTEIIGEMDREGENILF